MIWRVEIYEVQLGSIGFHFFGNRDAAMAFCRKEYPEYKIAGRNDFAGDCCILDSHETPRRKGEVLRLLKNWASHPDNG